MLVMFGRKRSKHVGPEEDLRCSFCKKHHQDVKKLIAGPDVFICDECVAVCTNIIADDERFPSQPTEAESDASDPGARQTSPPPLLPLPCALCGTGYASSLLLPVPDLGPVCPGCVARIEEAIRAHGPGATPAG